jgi:succinate dehydrogenase flavin-adding protein (antitoxin of CptAB toxin-antitoxin module)
MITKAEKIYKRMQKAHKLLSEIEMDMDMDLVNWCVDEIDSDDENVDKMVNAILDFPDSLRDYAMRMRS